MELKSLAATFAVLAILEPSAKICQLTARLASAGTVTDEETDSQVIKEIKNSLPQLQAELNGINKTKLQAMEKVLTKILTPDA